MRYADCEIPMSQDLRFTVETELETDGRWIAEIPQVSGAVAYGKTKEEAMNKAYAIALRSVADDVEHSEEEPPNSIVVIKPKGTLSDSPTP